MNMILMISCTFKIEIKFFGASNLYYRLKDFFSFEELSVLMIADQQKPTSNNWLHYCRNQPSGKSSFPSLVAKRLSSSLKSSLTVQMTSQVYIPSLGNHVQILQTCRLIRKLNARSIKVETGEILKHKCRQWFQGSVNKRQSLPFEIF